MDLAAWWRARRWRELLELIEQLPTASRLNEATLNDPEAAALINAERQAEEAAAQETGEETEPWSPRFSEFDLHAQMLRDVINELADLRAVTIAAAGGKYRRPKDYPRPRTEVDRLRERSDREWAQWMTNLFLPGAA